MIKPIPKINLQLERLEDFCRRWQIREFSLFGSVLRDDFGPDSDIDVLVTFLPEASWSLLDIVRLTNELEGIFGRKVDFLTRKAVENSPNWIRKKSILESAEVFYAA